jgi:hypothetical protein
MVPTSPVVFPLALRSLRLPHLDLGSLLQHQILREVPWKLIDLTYVVLG